MVHSQKEEHWARIFREKAAEEVSWYQASPEPSLYALDRLGAGLQSSIIDVGGGASNLVDALLDRGWRDITVLDIAAPALEVAKTRLGPRAAKVQWEVADITSWRPSRKYDVWHDRAVFHFLTDAGQRRDYRQALSEGLSEGGWVIMATFALDGPGMCSGLPTQQYDAKSLARELGPSFSLIESWREEHVTPWGAMQAFTWCTFRLA